jgi:2-polyprenyl-3-methyl-5-hydroxy-6-metoxy-1,4-benzoquinol methylase
MSDQGNEGLLSPILKNARFKAVSDLILPGDLVLDIGCGSGDLAQLIKPLNYYGYDIDEYSLSLAKKKYPKHVFKNKLPTKKFNKIISLAVIEHVKGPIKFLNNLKSNLKSSGIIILSTPHPAFEWIHDIGSRLGLFSSHASEEHETLINYKSMLKISRKSGLKIISSRRFLFFANQLFILGREK